MRLFQAPPPQDGHTFLPNKFIFNESISNQAKMAYLSTASRVQAGEPEPDEQAIADEMGMTLDEVRDGIRELDAISDEDWAAMQP